MKEAFLHYLFDQRKLGDEFQTTKGETLKVERFGELNKDAGPDFQNAKVTLDNKVWAGHIEFHVKSSDWMKHKHQFDPAYKNVIAHFVYEHDLEVKSGEYELPVVELRELIKKEEQSKYDNFISSKGWVPCQKQISSIPQELLKDTISEKTLERLSRKGQEILKLKESLNGDSQRVLYLLLAKYLGGKVNQKSFLRLAEMIHPSNLMQLNFDNHKITALLLGLSGLLPDKSEDEYVLGLKKEYEYISHLFQLNEMQKEEWKFSSLRPAGNPIIRIAQLAAILSQQSLYSSFLDNTREQLAFIKLDPFWKTHYNFQNKTAVKSVHLGEGVVNSILINAIAPLKHSQFIDSEDEIAKLESVNLLKNLKAEKNTITSHWKKIGVPALNAFESQGLIELKNEHCNRKKCLLCGLGKSILNK
jgi:Protein of unknown function (DUF2851)